LLENSLCEILCEIALFRYTSMRTQLGVGLLADPVHVWVPSGLKGAAIYWSASLTRGTIVIRAHSPREPGVVDAHIVVGFPGQLSPSTTLR
jgi:hypothetical protein